MLIDAFLMGLNRNQESIAIWENPDGANRNRHADGKTAVDYVIARQQVLAPGYEPLVTKGCAPLWPDMAGTRVYIIFVHKDWAGCFCP